MPRGRRRNLKYLQILNYSLSWEILLGYREKKKGQRGNRWEEEVRGGGEGERERLE